MLLEAYNLGLLGQGLFTVKIKAQIKITRERKIEEGRIERKKCMKCYDTLHLRY
jgi:hypothetical protein